MKQDPNPPKLNPFTAPACKMSGLKVDGHPRKQSVFWLYVTSTLNAMRFDENPFTCRCEKEKEKKKKRKKKKKEKRRKKKKRGINKAKGFRISHF